MGQKVSAVHGVRSGNFFRPGNAINELWVGNVELISRLPFGDSDMGQAGWPAGGIPKIPWHNFIIPLKKRALDITKASLFGGQHEQAVDAISAAPRDGHDPQSEAAPIDFPRSKALVFFALLSCISFAAYYLSVLLRQHTMRHSWFLWGEKLREKKRMYAFRGCIAMISFVIGFMSSLVAYRALGHIFGGWTLFWSRTLYLGFMFTGCLRSLAATDSFFRDWIDAVRQMKGDYLSVPTDLINEHMPKDVVSWLEKRQQDGKI